jgi:hypothetical protein
MRIVDTTTEPGREGGRQVTRIAFTGEGGGRIELTLPDRDSGDAAEVDLYDEARALLLAAAEAAGEESLLTEPEPAGDGIDAPLAGPAPLASLEEEDDDLYARPDEALPDDGAERALDRDPSLEGGRFGEV